MTADHMFSILESEADSELLVQVVSKLAVGDVPDEVIDGIRVGRLTALAKPDGGVRVIVVGDIIRRLVARTIAKQFAKKAEAATAPFQCALSKKAGCECVAHIVQALTEQDANATVVTVDGIGAFDLISRSALLEGLLRMEDGDQILLFARCFYDELGNTQEIPQSEAGEQGDLLMPMLFSLGEHPALEAIQRRLIDGEKLLAYLDDITVLCSQREFWQWSPSLMKSSLTMHRSACTMGRRRCGTVASNHQVLRSLPDWPDWSNPRPLSGGVTPSCLLHNKVW